MRTPNARNPAGGPGFEVSHHNNFYAQNATVETLLQRLDAVQKSGNGWRAKCPACGGQSRKLSVSQSDDRVLIHCFGCSDADGVLAAVGLKWTDLLPPRTWPQSPEDRKRARRAIRECGWSAALSVLPTEAVVLHLAAQMIADAEPLPVEDRERLALACMRVDRAALVLVERETWKPDYCYQPARLVALKRDAVTELRRQLDRAEMEATAAEAALAALNHARGAA